MKLGIGTGYLDVYGFEKGLSLMNKQGYETLDYNIADTSMDLYSLSDKDLTERINRYNGVLSKNNIEVSQIHGPWRFPPQDSTEGDREERFEKMAKAIYITKLLNCKYIVIHPLMPFGFNQNPDEDKFMEINYDFFSKLLPIAVKNNVTVCLENMPMPALPLASPLQILNFVKKINNPNFKVCLDTGHSIVLGVAPNDAVLQLTGEYLKVLHVHDNDGISDLHLMPYTGVINWAKFSESLQSINFEGSVSLETFVPLQLKGKEREVNENTLFENLKRIARR